MRVAAIGRTRILLETVRELARTDHELEAVVTCEPADFYRAGIDDFRRAAAEIGADFHVLGDINSDENRSTLESYDLDVAVSVNWKTVIRPAVLDSFSHGIVNYHAGDLPRYRGNAAMNWAIVAGESEIVHTLHFMSERLDAGPILAQRRSPIGETTTIGDVYQFAEEHVPEMFARVVDDIASGAADPSPQSTDPEDALRCYPRRPEDSKLEWKRSADYLDRVVRASSEPLFGAYTYLDGRRLRVWRAHPEDPDFEWLGTPGQVAERRPDAGEVAVCTGDGFLVLETVEPEDGSRQSAAEHVTSVRARLGRDAHDEIGRLKERIARLESEVEE